MVGVFTVAEALQRARAAGVDLIEISPNANPPVCKLQDYGKYLYRLNKVERKHRAKQKKGDTKEVRIGFATGEHDLEVKAKRAERFLKDGNRVKITLQFRGREISHFDFGKGKLENFLLRFQEFGKIDQEIKKQGGTLTAVLKPLN